MIWWPRSGGERGVLLGACFVEPHMVGGVVFLTAVAAGVEGASWGFDEELRGPASIPLLLDATEGEERTRSAIITSPPLKLLFGDDTVLPINDLALCSLSTRFASPSRR